MTNTKDSSMTYTPRHYRFFRLRNAFSWFLVDFNRLDPETRALPAYQAERQRRSDIVEAARIDAGYAPSSRFGEL